MPATNVAPHEWSAKKLALVSSVIACTLTAVISAVVVLRYLPLPASREVSRVSMVILIILTSYIQLMASTIHHSPVGRSGNTIEGWIFGEIGDDYVHTTVRWWVWFWFYSPFAVSFICNGFIMVFMYVAMNKP